ncbi:MAG: MGMT family protein [candidate division Zixibacteria bacterium]|nr:MGMT family protein [candidate division Zixibacteria bacterium]
MTFTEKALAVIQSIPEGKVMTYGSVAAAAGSPRGARQVVRVLHSLSDKEGLPWHRVVNREGRISLERGRGYELQKALLEDEGVVFGLTERIDLDTYLWQPSTSA